MKATNPLSIRGRLEAALARQTMVPLYRQMFEHLNRHGAIQLHNCAISVVATLLEPVAFVSPEDPSPLRD